MKKKIKDLTEEGIEYFYFPEIKTKYKLPKKISKTKWEQLRGVFGDASKQILYLLCELFDLEREVEIDESNND